MDTGASPSSDTAASRWRRWLPWLAVIVGFAIVQSITVTPGIKVRYVDASSGAPLAQLPVMGVWRLQSATPAGSLRSSVLRVERATTDSSGELSLDTAMLWHAPVFPFGLGVREPKSLPMLYALADGYEPSIAGSASRASGERQPLSFLALQRSTLNGSTVQVARVVVDQGDPERVRSSQDHRNAINDELQQADSSCRRRVLCQRDEE